MEVERKIKELLVRVLHLNVAPSELGDHEPLFDGLGLDSLATLELIAGIEEEFGIRVEDEELTVELFESVASLSKFVRNKLGIGVGDMKKGVKATGEKVKRPDSDLPEVFRTVRPEHQRALDFLALWTPPEDFKSLDAEVLIEHVEYSYIARGTVPWGGRIGEELFFGYVLPYRTWAEPIGRWRKLLYSELYPLVGRLADPVEAAMEVNRWAAGKAHFKDIPVTYKSPLRTIADGCGDRIDLSIFLVAACRSVGIPARGVFSPWMPLGHDGTHMWTEVWEGKWYYLGSCEPERAPDRAWFSMHIKRAAKVYALSFRGTGSMLGLRYCPDVWVEDVTDRYTTVGTLRVKVTADGIPIPECSIYVLVPSSKNELVLVASLETDVDGLVEMKLGSQVEVYFICAGDLRKNCGQFVHIDTGRTKEVHLKM